MVRELPNSRLSSSGWLIARSSGWLMSIEVVRETATERDGRGREGETATRRAATTPSFSPRCGVARLRRSRLRARLRTRAASDERMDRHATLGMRSARTMVTAPLHARAEQAMMGEARRHAIAWMATQIQGGSHR